MFVHVVDFAPSYASMSQYTTLAGDSFPQRFSEDFYRSHIWEVRSSNPEKCISADELLRCFKGIAFISVILKHSIVLNRAASAMNVFPSPFFKVPHSITTRDLRKTVVEEQNTQIV